MCIAVHDEDQNHFGHTTHGLQVHHLFQLLHVLYDDNFNQEVTKKIGTCNSFSKGNMHSVKTKSITFSLHVALSQNIFTQQYQ